MNKIVKLTLILFLVCAIVAGILGGINELTKGPIAEPKAIKTAKEMCIRDSPMPTPLNSEVVIAMVAHMPICCTRTGLLVMRPSLNCFLMFIRLPP